MSIILVDTFYYLSLSHPYTESLEHYSVQVLQLVSSLFVKHPVIGVIHNIILHSLLKSKI